MALSGALVKEVVNIPAHRTHLVRRTGGLPHAAAFGAMAAGALAVGSLAIGALAIGRLAIKKARIGTLEIDELGVRKIRGTTLPGRNGEVNGELRNTVASVAEDYVSLCRRGDFDLAMERFFSSDHIRIESKDMTGPPVEIRGLEAIRQNSRQFSSGNEVHRVEIDGPFLGSDRFAVRFNMDVTSSRTAERITISKVDLYTLQNGKITRSEAYYNAPYLSGD